MLICYLKSNSITGCNISATGYIITERIFYAIERTDRKRVQSSISDILNSFRTGDERIEEL